MGKTAFLFWMLAWLREQARGITIREWTAVLYCTLPPPPR